MIEIGKFQVQDAEEWDKFVCYSSNSSFYHLTGWKRVIEKSYRHKAYYLIAKENGKIVGIFPLFLIKKTPLINSLVSMPFLTHGGLCANDENVEKVLIYQAKDLARELKVGYLEIRSLYPLGYNLKERLVFFTFIIDLTNGEDWVWKNMKKRVRGSIRKGYKSGLKVKFDPEELSSFYKIYSQSVKRLGTPVHSYKFYENILNEFKEKVNIFSVFHKDKIIASILFGAFKDTVYPLCPGSLEEYNIYCPNNVMLWELIRYACRKGYKLFDFGRSSRDSGAFNFKKRWGGRIVQLHYLYYLHGGNEVSFISPREAKHKLFSYLWKRLPLKMTKLIGPSFRRYIP